MIKIGQKVSMIDEFSTDQGIQAYTVVDILQRNEIVIEREDGLLFWTTENRVKENNRKEENKR